MFQQHISRFYFSKLSPEIKNKIWRHGRAAKGHYMTVLGSYYIFFYPKEESSCQNDTGVKADPLVCEHLGLHLRDLSYFRMCADSFK